MAQNYNKMYKTEAEAVIREPLDIDKVYKTEEVVREPIVLKSALVYNCIALNVRELPNIASKILLVLNKNDKVQIKSTSDVWAHVITTLGVEGYVLNEYIKEV